MRTLRAAFVATLACLMFAGTLAAEDAPAEQQGVTEGEAIALVLATDPRYTDLRDFRRLEIERAANFDMDIVLGSDY